MSAIMVEIRCKGRGCGKLLLEVAEEPDWSSTLRVPPCPRHHGHVPVADGPRASKRLRDAARRHGSPFPIVVALEVPAEGVRDAVDRWRRTGRTQVLTV